MVVRVVVVGTPTVVVHLHEVGLGLLVDLRPTDPSLAFLAIDRQALLLDEEAPSQFLTGGRGGGHGHTQPSSGKLSSSSGKWKGPADPSLAILAIERQALLLDEEAPKQFLAGGRGGGHVHTKPFSQT